MTDTPNRDLAPTGEIARRRYLDILHQFTLRQSRLSTLDDIVWNIAKTAIAELGFEDCVVYLLADDGVTLRQVAAHGPKNPVAREIYNEITIPLGDGIVGHVAKTGDIQCIADTRQDSRYILDDNARLSELAVPITHAGRVIGVLDSEHAEANFFSDEDVQLFTTIASLASTRIETAMAMERLVGTVEHLEKARLQLELQAEELRESRLAAEAASIAKTNFLANMSHEIRTPMTAIVGFAELLAEGGGSGDQQATWRGQLTRNAAYLQDLIGNILDMSAIESGTLQVEKEDIELLSTVTGSVEILRARAGAKGLELTCKQPGSVPERVVTDRIKLQEIIVNLVSNAVKYTEHGAIDVELSAEQDGDRARVAILVRDTGMGMTESQLENLFVPFNRVHDTHRLAGIEGTGLGLALTHEFVEVLGGQVTVTSQPGEGSEFTVSIPCELPADAVWRAAAVDNPFLKSVPVKPVSQPVTSEPPQSLRDFHILFCEDSEPIALLLATLLKKAGARIDHCANGMVGLQLFEELVASGTPPDLVLMDMQMPVMDGYEATGRFKKLQGTVPVVALTAFALKEDIDRCRRAGCDHYLTKPIQSAAFANTVREIYDSYRQQLASGMH